MTTNSSWEYILDQHRHTFRTRISVCIIEQKAMVNCCVSTLALLLVLLSGLHVYGSRSSSKLVQHSTLCILCCAHAYMRIIIMHQCEAKLNVIVIHTACGLPKVVGPCKAAFPRWFFNTKTRKCERFIYGGCGGNANNFNSLQACLNKCGEASSRLL